MAATAASRSAAGTTCGSGTAAGVPKSLSPSSAPERTEGAGEAESCAHDRVCGVGAATVARNGREKRLAVEREQPHVVDSPDRCRPGHVSQQSDLTEIVARAKRRDLLPVDVDSDLALRDHIEVVASIALG